MLSDHTFFIGRMAHIGIDDVAELIRRQATPCPTGEGWAVLSQRVKLEARFAGMTLIPRPIVGKPLAIAMCSDVALHRAVQAAPSAILHGPEFEAMAMHWSGQAGRGRYRCFKA